MHSGVENHYKNHCPVLSCLVLSCRVLSFLVPSCRVLSCPVLSCAVLSCLVLSCLVLSCLFVFVTVVPARKHLAPVFLIEGGYSGVPGLKYQVAELRGL